MSKKEELKEKYLDSYLSCHRRYFKKEGYDEDLIALESDKYNFYLSDLDGFGHEDLTSNDLQEITIKILNELIQDGFKMSLRTKTTSLNRVLYGMRSSLHTLEPVENAEELSKKIFKEDYAYWIVLKKGEKESC